MTALAGHPAVVALRAGRDRALVALDFDGTLAPVGPNPSAVRAVPGTAEVLHGLRTRLAVVTGRPAAEAVELGGLEDIPGLVVLGQYGAQRWEAGHLTSPPPHPGVAPAREQLRRLPEGAWLEDKGLSLVVHTRPAADPAGLLERLRPRVADVAAGSGLELHDGRLVLELRAPGYDKGAALRSLLEPVTSAVVYAGDDRGDLPAFAAARAWGGPSLLVASGSGEGPPELAHAADVVVDGPAGVVALLGEL